MKYCLQCGNQLKNKAKFCDRCGTTQDASVNDTRESTSTKPKKPFPKVTFAIIAIVLIVLAVLPKSKTPSSETPASTLPAEVIVNVTKYANITSQELEELSGKADSVESGTCTGEFAVPCTYYDYSRHPELGDVSFVLVNDRVVRFTSYKDFPYNKETVLQNFGVNSGSGGTLVGDTGVSWRYRCPTASIDDFWVSIIEGNTFGCLQVTYDMMYYSEWYLPMSADERAVYQTKTETAVKSLLISPKTADFPWTDWNFAKNNFYIAVDSYVDAKNALGVEVRNDFVFIYSRLTGEIVAAVFDGEVIANNGFVSTETLIMQLIENGTVTEQVQEPEHSTVHMLPYTPTDEPFTYEDETLYEEQQTLPQEVPIAYRQIFWDDFVYEYNDIIRAIDEEYGYLIEDTFLSDHTDAFELSPSETVETLYYDFPSGESLEVELINREILYRFGYTYPSQSQDEDLILNHWYMLSALVGASTCVSHNEGWTTSVESTMYEILACIGLVNASDEVKADYQAGEMLVYEDDSYGAIYFRWVDLEANMSHMFVSFY